MTVRIQTGDFDVGIELKLLRLANANVGAVVSFIGQVRDFNDDKAIQSLTLEHYPGMTEKALTAIACDAKSRWNIIDSLIIHRVGTLKPLDQIVLVAVTAAHRGEAFKACEFMMDFLKTKAPFWKKEETPTGAHWVDAKQTDDAAAISWKT